MRYLKILLFPVSFLYGAVTFIRNWLFDKGIFKATSFDFPVICVGNLCYGGTGKTPLIEYIIRILNNNGRKISTLSRGYGRKTKGFIIADEKCSSCHIGDEPCQFYNKFRNITVAVDEKRVRGIEQLKSLIPELNAVLLDDAFQHRKVKAGLSILLTDYYFLYTDDHLIPTGTLRELRSGADRADIIVVTKTPVVLSPITKKSIIDKLQTKPNQSVFFSQIKYGTLLPVGEDIMDIGNHDKKFYTILLITGIANPYPLEEYLRRYCVELILKKYKDHHEYTDDDLDDIKETFKYILGKNKIIVTTEKDMIRLRDSDKATHIKDLPLYYIPIEVDFHGGDKEMFDKIIIEYVDKNKRDS
jgi:tetraacyldisaccharide 4'-kinase